MNNYKYSIGQLVKIKKYNPWVGDYEVQGEIKKIGNIILNGHWTYDVDIGEPQWLLVSEKDIEV